MASALGKLPPLPAHDPVADPLRTQGSGTDEQRISDRFTAHLPRAEDLSGRDLAGIDREPESSPQMATGFNLLAMTALDASWRELAVNVANSGGGTRTPDTRIMIPRVH